MNAEEIIKRAKLEVINSVNGRGTLPHNIIELINLIRELEAEIIANREEYARNLAWEETSWLMY